MQKFERALGWIVKIGLWLIPILPLYISSSMLFPYITGKNFTFRIIVEIIFAAWVGLAILKAEYRPRLTPLFKIITIFAAIVFLADLFSPNPYRSFFSNYERMEGFMMIGHLYLYFILLAAMFKTRRDWLVFFHVSLAASVIASFYGLLQHLGLRPSIQGAFRVDSTIGNPSYFAAYLLFHVWLLAIFGFQYRKAWWRVALYGALLIAELVMIYFTATRGVVLALVAVVIPLMATLTVFWNRMFGVGQRGAWSPGRIVMAGALVVAIAVPIVFWSMRSSDVIQKNPALRRLTNYSLQEGSIQNRTMIWGMSLKGIAERPILGWGQENYYLVFQKYFNPGLYAAEPWFDRSHNVVLDWAVHTGLLGLAAYLAIFAVALREIIRAMRRDQNVFFEGLLLICLFVTYFLQNLFVFDNLSSYLLFFAFLAYAQQMHKSNGKLRDTPDAARGRARGATRFSYAVAGMAAAYAGAAVWGYLTILQPAWKSMALIRALGAVQSRATIPEVQAAFGNALAYQAFGNTEVREQLGNIARDVAGSGAGTPEERKQFVEFALGELRRETSDPAKDVKHLLFMESILGRALVLDTRYAVEAEVAGREAIRLSPTKQAAYLESAQLFLSLNRLDDALRALQQAWALDRSFRQAAANVWTVAIFAKNQAAIDEVKRSFALTDFEGFSIFNIARAYQQVEDYDHAREAFAEVVKWSPLDPQYHATYAALLMRAGDRIGARKEVEEAIRLDPNFEKEGRIFLQQLQ